jgi:hypothetical protein
MKIRKHLDSSTVCVSGAKKRKLCEQRDARESRGKRNVEKMRAKRGVGMQDKS